MASITETLQELPTATEFPETGSDDPDILEASPEYLADRHLVEDFALRVKEAAGEQCVVAVLLPWTRGLPPQGVIAPASRDGTYEMDRVAQAVEGKNAIVIPCTLKYKDEETAGVTAIKQLHQAGASLCLLAAHVFAEGVDNVATQQNYDDLIEVHEGIGRLGVDDVLLDPDWDVPGLKLRIRLAYHSWSVNRQRLQAMLAEEPGGPSPAEVDRLEAIQRELLWKHIPRELMSYLKSMDSSLEESDTRAGEYILDERMGYTSVWEGRDQNQNKVAVKITDKAEVFRPVEVEGIYREFRFLAGMVRHPNIVSAHDCFHGAKKVYIVMDFAGKVNLDEHLSRLPEQRMREAEVLGYFYRIASAIHHCHCRKVVHRSIALEHVVMQPEADGSHTPKLVNFRSAMIAKEGVTSTTLCGSLPCMAPEMMRGGSIPPKPSDLWSLGVLLLEMAGGRGSFFKATQIDEATAIQQLEWEDAGQMLADQIEHYFNISGKHAFALSCMNGVSNSEVLMVLERLLQSADQRGSLEQILPAQELADATAGVEADE